MSAATALPQVELDWADSCRLVPSRFPPISLFEAVADPADLAAVFAIESLGNPRLRDEIGELSLVPADQRVSGPGCSPIMAAFTHLNPEGSRFSNGSYGVYYAAAALETAVAELSHHRARFLARTAEPAIEVDLRCYRVRVKALLHDLRGQHGIQHQAFYDPDSYAASQRFGLGLREAGAAGIAYDSVRHAAGQCVALFTPRATMPPARQAEQVTLRWNGQRISGWYLKSDSRLL
ncbi:RES family NAD+ phosphorylase [Roseateles toxinivorans]|uniref:RES domain-containing protein n=1 Tax=Roseateles toxinivorans TaxID=270368 RepID=A0A4R6QIC0_9BURK|nr:RES family NAD+ phosphorylase [Roseateles toxinivorans]TDP61372.1 RES domain-containing protein [Roseateles toxinivorans]